MLVMQTNECNLISDYSLLLNLDFRYGYTLVRMDHTLEH